MTSARDVIPVVPVAPATAAAFDRTLGPLVVDDRALADSGYQERFLAAARDAAGAAFDELAGQVRTLLAAAPWAVVVRGLPVSHATTVLTALSAALGTLVEPNRQPWSRFVRELTPARDRPVDGRSITEFLHTDGTDWPRPNDYTCLFCVRPDQHGGGESRLLDVETLLADAAARPRTAALVERLADRPVPWRVSDDLGGGVHRAPAIDAATPGIRWMRYTVTQCQQEGLADIPADLLDDLGRFEEFVERSAAVVRLPLGSGDLLIVDNTRNLHARTAIPDPARSARDMRRTKVVRKTAATPG